MKGSKHELVIIDDLEAEMFLDDLEKSKHLQGMTGYMHGVKPKGGRRMTTRRTREFVSDIESLCKKYGTVVDIEIAADEPILVMVRNWCEKLSHNVYRDYRRGDKDG